MEFRPQASSARARHNLFRPEAFVQLHRHVSRPQLIRTGRRVHGSGKPEDSRIPFELQLRPPNIHWPALGLLALLRSRTRQTETHIPLQPQHTFIRLVFDADRFAGSVWQPKRNWLRRPRDARRPFERHSLGFDMNDARCRQFRMPLDRSKVRRAHQIHLYRPAAINVLWIFRVTAGPRMQQVVPVLLFAKNGDLHIFQQARRFAFEIRRVRRLHGINRYCAFHFRKRNSAQLPFDPRRCRRWRIPSVPNSLPAAREIHSRGNACKAQRQRCGPLRVLRRFTSLHKFQLSKNWRDCIATQSARRKFIQRTRHSRPALLVTRGVCRYSPRPRCRGLYSLRGTSLHLPGGASLLSSANPLDTKPRPCWPSNANSAHRPPAISSRESACASAAPRAARSLSKSAATTAQTRLRHSGTQNQSNGSVASTRSRCPPAVLNPRGGPACHSPA